MDNTKAMQAAVDDFKKGGGRRSRPEQAGKSIGDNSKPLAEMEAKRAAGPRMFAIYRKHGLTAEDVVLMPFVLLDAGMAVAYPSAAAKLADRTSPAQIAFYKQHQAELKKMSWLSGG